MSDPRMVVMGIGTMMCTQCQYMFQSKVEGDKVIARHQSSEDFHEDQGPIRDFIGGCPLSGKTFAFPVATELVGTEVIP